MKIVWRGTPFGRVDVTAWSRGEWPARWVDAAEAAAGPRVTLFRLAFTAEGRETVRLHVTADERYTLYLDGVLVGRGSQRGNPWRWLFESYELALTPGPHVLVARVWQVGEKRPMAQMSVHPGFLLAADEPWMDRLATGKAAWEAMVLSSYTFTGGPINWGPGHDEVVDCAGLAPGWRCGEGAGWTPVRVLAPGVTGAMSGDGIGMHHRLAPADLPAQVDRAMQGSLVRHVDAPPGDYTRNLPVRAADQQAGEAPAWQAWWSGGKIEIPAHTRRRVVVDLGNYYCFYPSLSLTGGRGAVVRMHTSESLYEEKADPNAGGDHVWTRPKGHRDEIEGKTFVGHGPTWIASGVDRQVVDTLWWLPGRYVELLVSTHDEALTLSGLELRETRYPIELESRCTTPDARLQAALPVLARGIQMCAHETFMDCPYWEQLMYTGDTRLQALCVYAMTPDDRLPRRALELFDESRLPNGLTQSRYPCLNGQLIPPFSLYWVSMLHDFARWRDGASLVCSMLPGVRAAMHAHLQHKRVDGLVEPVPGWNFVDWVPGWRSGEPPGALGGVSSVLMGQLAYTLRQVEELERLAGDAAHAAIWRAEAESLVRALLETCWDEERGLLADTPERTSFSEHAQCFALLSGLLPAAKAERMVEGLARRAAGSEATIYFAHYVLEALAAGGRDEAFFQRLELWKELPERGFKTPYEAPGNTRSDCHAWGSHPLYHLFASVCGIQPAALGFRTVSIRPMPGPLPSLDAELVHPMGRIAFQFTREGGRARFVIALPEGVSGTLYWRGEEHALAGRQDFMLPG